MRLTGVDPSFPPSTPRRRCRHKSLTDRLKPSDGCCQNCASWTAPSAALLRSESERFATFMIEENLGTIFSCITAKRTLNFSQSHQWLEKCSTRAATGKAYARHRSCGLLNSFPTLSGP